MNQWLLRVGLLAAFALASLPAKAAGIDCTKARSPVDKAICASPPLLALDRQIASAYADALAREPDRQPAMRSDLLRWLKQRDAACALPSAQIPRCLNEQLTARLAALAPPAQAASQPSLPPPPPPAGTQPAAPLLTTPAATRPADPAIPRIAIPPGAASLEQASVPAAEHAETFLRVTSPGRFSLTAKSASGATLQLVDLMTGPGETDGVAGSKDGRLDPLLDVGTYKLRVASAKGATGNVALTVTPFHDAALPAAAPPPGYPVAATLKDGEQRAFWMLVGPDGSVRVEAAGRSLADLRLWRDGRELSGLFPEPVGVEPKPGHPLADYRITGKVEPGPYLAIAYGGPALPWTDNDASQPFLLRSGASPVLAEGWAGGPMGPFGSEVFAVPAATGLLRLSLPASAPASLLAGGAIGDITAKSREPTVSMAGPPGKAEVVEVRAAEGQAFTLQALERPGTTRWGKAGTYWTSAVANGTGGDEVPPAFVLERTQFDGKPPRIVASTVPQVGSGVAWHTRFNLRGPTFLPVQNTVGGAIQYRTTGVAVTERQQANAYDLSADWYRLELSPFDGAFGSLDLVIGPPGAPAPPLVTFPRDPVIPLGEQVVGPGQSLVLSGTEGPGVQIGLSARLVPVALAEGPLTVTQTPGAPVTVPVRVAAGGTLAVSEIGGGAVGYTMAGNAVTVPGADHARSVVLASRRAAGPAPAIPAPPPLEATTALDAGKPVTFDLDDKAGRSFLLNVATGGLYRVETTGRLHTTGKIATAFIPGLGDADGNGTGQNMLLQQVLRAGRYRVSVAAQDSAGHLGLVATPAPILDGPTLVPGGSVRASLPAGSAATFPLVVAGPGEDYKLDVASLGAPWQGRIEDAQGWPLTRTQQLGGATPALPAGSYGLVVSPDVTARQVVARLTAVTKPVDITGHGPHDLPFEAKQAATWREPDGRDQPRTPDAWAFVLSGPAAVTLRLSDGMAGELRREGQPTPLARIVGKYTGTLEAGSYRLEATSLGRRDRLAYTVNLASEALQPGVPRSVTLPGSVGFAIAEPRVASLTTFGNVPIKGVLRREDGGVVARYGARADDWNIAASRLLPAGKYTLDLDAASPPDVSAVVIPTAQGASDESDSEPKPDGEQEAKTDDGQAAQTAPSMDGSGGERASGDQPAKADDTSDDAPKPKTEVRLALPAALPARAAPAEATALVGTGVHLLTLDAPAAGTLLVAQASSSASLVLTLERRSGGGWRTVALDEGTAPVVASPADGDPAAWRVEAWTVDGGAEPITFAARAVVSPAQKPASAALVQLEKTPSPVAVAHVGMGDPAPVSVTGAGGLLAGGWPGQALAKLNGPVLPQGQDIWLLSRTPTPVSVAALPLADPQAMVVPPGQSAQLPPAAAAAGHLFLWRADGGFGQPGLGASAGVARGSAVARADAPVTLRNASSGDRELRATLTRLDVALLPTRTLDAPLRATMPPRSALSLTIPAGDKEVSLDTGANVALFAGGVTAWAGDAPLSRTMTGAATDLLLVNAGNAPAPASLSWQPAPAPVPLKPGSLTKRFFGAAGSFEIAYDTAEAAHLATAGDATLTTIGADGSVGRGHAADVSGSGRVVVEHGIGPVAVWMSTDKLSPWPDAVATAATAPARMPLSGPAMALTIDRPDASLLHVTTTAPVLAALKQAGRADPPRLFPAGAEMHLVLAAGPAELRLYSPTDGPLTGTLALSADPLTATGEGLGAPVAVAPGNAAAFAFDLRKAATIGVGVRSDPDSATVRLLDATGAVKGVGVAQIVALTAGRYVIEASVPPDAPPTTVTPAIVGITPRGSGPPPDVAQHYLELVGLKPKDAP